MYPKSDHVDPALLRPNPWNTNRVGPENEAKIAASLREFGFVKPLIVREVGEELEILGGEHRWVIAQDIGLKVVPIFNLGPIEDDAAKKIGLLDNARYGEDDAIELSRLIESLGGDDLQNFLPYTDDDLKAMRSSVDIALDKLDLDADATESELADEPKVAAPVKTHTTMRYQVENTDAERIADLVTRTMKRQGFTAGSELQNAGDALVFLLLGAGAAPAPEFPDAL